MVEEIARPGAPMVPERKPASGGGPEAGKYRVDRLGPRRHRTTDDAGCETGEEAEEPGPRPRVGGAGAAPRAGAQCTGLRPAARRPGQRQELHLGEAGRAPGGEGRGVR